ncbi:UDP-N-acetylmuramate dehydrogenase [Alkalimonas amylolytica]|uniref:UDP-N-acetylenolpyruvoylglucosamine reductase n=1 Tax=Alkalimonas amylolytica TaxID=152573 RepID=A0A1H4FGG0_ALKAM|nr:UDP-N-acetylmuramate dehydrogenase [Alkalimonas amylolytica]SEA96463.1 UDP-N-acetylmuramate dehydrogenase [Alkalimonas amylolytica]
MEILVEQDGRDYSTFRLPARLATVYQCQQLDDLRQVPLEPKPRVQGEGSNTVFIGDELPPLCRFVASTKELRWLDDDRALLHVEAGHNWHQLVCWTVEQGLWGLENLALIPGSVGAAPVQNIGAYGVELADRCRYVDFFHWDSQQVQRLDVSDCAFAYRDSVFKHQLAGQGVIVAVGFTLSKSPRRVLSYQGLDKLPANCTLQQVLATVVTIRQSKLPDPGELANCGSFFKNPLLPEKIAQALQLRYPAMPVFAQGKGQSKLSAAWLIDQAGFKGKKLGDIGCYSRQPLVLVNHGAGTAEQLLQLIESIQLQVQTRFGVALETEVQLVGQLSHRASVSL